MPPHHIPPDIPTHDDVTPGQKRAQPGLACVQFVQEGGAPHVPHVDTRVTPATDEEGPGQDETRGHVSVTPELVNYLVLRQTPY